jgi:hypothetical protein
MEAVWWYYRPTQRLPHLRADVAEHVVRPLRRALLCARPRVQRGARARAAVAAFSRFSTSHRRGAATRVPILAAHLQQRPERLTGARRTTPTYDAFGVFGTALQEKIGVFHSTNTS